MLDRDSIRRADPRDLGWTSRVVDFSVTERYDTGGVTYRLGERLKAPLGYYACSSIQLGQRLARKDPYPYNT